METESKQEPNYEVRKDLLKERMSTIITYHGLEYHASFSEYPDGCEIDVPIAGPKNRMLYAVTYKKVSMDGLSAWEFVDAKLAR